MKNANVFVDVDLTLVDANGKLLTGALEALQRLRDEGCHLFLWSSGGAEYCRKVAHLHGLTELFEGFTAKPDIVIDDMPTCRGRVPHRLCTMCDRRSRGRRWRNELSKSTRINSSALASS
jgi:phosphoserine phosphatase